jgi:GH15 family glucan-1,4-alpha-glucosidase
MVWLGLRRLGYAQEAQRLADGVIAAAAREGLREYYDPRTGKGLGAKDFAWSALVAELAGPEDTGLTSYL